MNTSRIRAALGATGTKRLPWGLGPRRARSWLTRRSRALYYSLPVQLLVNQLASHRFLLLSWGFLFLLVTGTVGNSLGVPQVFLEPEFNQRVSFASCFLLGLALGIFTLAFQMTSYIFDGYRFYFIALLRNPFRVFTVNNSILPLLFWVTYLVCFYRFQTREPGPLPPGEVVPLMLALVLGGAVIELVANLYFSLTNRSALFVLGERFVRGLQNPLRMARRTRVAMDEEVKVTSYLTTRLSIRPVVQIVRGDTRPILQVLNQNHANAIVVIVVLSALLLAQGLFQDLVSFQPPAGATVLLSLAFVVMLGGALAFWFRKIGPLVILGLLLLVVLVNSDSSRMRHPAYGLRYDLPPAEYSVDQLQQLADPVMAQVDSLRGIRQLEAWLASYRARHGTTQPPRMLLVCATGGGLRSATWTMRSLQAADSALDGRMPDYLRLMTGASGGMISTAYYRELLFLEQQGLLPAGLPPRNHPSHPDRVSRDLLNSVLNNYLAHTLLPSGTVTQHGHTYPRDRGYEFERQLIQNLDGIFQDRHLGDYAAAEDAARIPLLIFSPAVLHDGRQMLISSQPVAYLAQPTRFNPLYRNEVPAVEFRRLFAAHQPDSLAYTSAIRMNASFPYIFPFTELPTHPRIEVMDAGVSDNFGITLAVRYLYVFRHWIKAHTSGVVILQIRDSQREAPIQADSTSSTLSRLAGVLGGTYNTLAESRDFQNDDLLAYARSWFDAPLDVLELQYIPARAFEEASLNLHLTRRERADVLASIHNRENQQTLVLLRELLTAHRRHMPTPK